MKQNPSHPSAERFAASPPATRDLALYAEGAFPYLFEAAPSAAEAEWQARKARGVTIPRKKADMLKKWPDQSPQMPPAGELPGRLRGVRPGVVFADLTRLCATERGTVLGMLSRSQE